MTTVSSKIETMNPSFQPFTVLAVDDSAANDSLADAGGQAAGAGPSTVGVGQSRLPLLPQTFLETFHVTDAKRKQCGGSGARHVSLRATGNCAHSLQFLLTQCECPSSHGVTFSRCS
jgi:hypothetical protein